MPGTSTLKVRCGRFLPFKSTDEQPQQYSGQADQLTGVLITANRFRRSILSVCATAASQRPALLVGTTNVRAESPADGVNSVWVDQKIRWSRATKCRLWSR